MFWTPKGEHKKKQIYKYKTVFHKAILDQGRYCCHFVVWNFLLKITPTICKRKRELLLTEICIGLSPSLRGQGGGGEFCSTYSLNHCKHGAIQSFKSNKDRWVVFSYLSVGFWIIWIILNQQELTWQWKKTSYLYFS